MLNLHLEYQCFCLVIRLNQCTEKATPVAVLAFQEQGIHIWWTIKMIFIKSSDFMESYSLKWNVSFVHPLTFAMMASGKMYRFQC